MTSDSVESEDPIQLRLEILRLREQALGMEARNEYLAGRISNQDDQIDELQNRAAERDTWVAERDARNADKDARIAEKDAEIANKDARIAQLEAENLDLQSLLNRPAIIRLARRIARKSHRNEQL